MSKEMIQKDEAEYKFHIREFQKNHSDAQLLAECYNSWDDPKSWPGGFSHGDPFTAERILEEMDKQTPLSKFVAVADGKIVGHCDVLEHFIAEDIVYIGLLGVNPAYQSKKIGKNLLLKAINRAIELEKEIITLHTWGGNLKAVPLYKKVGYFWAPDSSVYMENFLPG
ncbi:MAG: GNAT family N-acetyltransferase, partial [Candidatus Thorarchaeota archaeon]